MSVKVNYIFLYENDAIEWYDDAIEIQQERDSAALHSQIKLITFVLHYFINRFLK